MSNSNVEPRQEMTRWKVCVVIPTRNEEATLEIVVGEVRAAFAAHGLREPTVIITDDSRDRTRSIARRLGVHVVIGGGQGLGFAMQRGLKAALAFHPDVIVSLDGDGQANPFEVGKFLEVIAADEADMVVASRFLRKGLIEYRYPLSHRVGVFLLSRILRWLTRQRFTDSHGGLRAMKAEVVKEMDLLGTHTYVQESIVDAHEKGFRVNEIPSIWRRRISGRSRVVRSVTTYAMYTFPVLMIRSGLHIRWLYTLAFAVLAGALAVFGVVAWQEGFRFKEMFSRLPAFLLIGVMVLAGIQLFSFGFLAELMKTLKWRIDRMGVGLPGPQDLISLPAQRNPAADSPSQGESATGAHAGNRADGQDPG